MLMNKFRRCKLINKFRKRKLMNKLRKRKLMDKFRRRNADKKIKIIYIAGILSAVRKCLTAGRMSGIIHKL
jgi:hypothetical protein